MLKKIHYTNNRNKRNMINTIKSSNLIDINLILKAVYVSERMKVADLGCGSSGFLSFVLARAVGKSGVVYAVDILRPKLETLERKIKQENCKNIITIWSNLEIFNATKIEAGSLDAVFLVNTLYQSTKKEEILRESVRLLKKGAKAVVIEWKNISIPFGPPSEE
ncbi:MAG: class I SAM-dependent methyltransferase, partial [Candidatus Gastranaerophilaceae bacterium]